MSKEELDKALEQLTKKYSSHKWPFDTSTVLKDCIAELGGLFAAQTSSANEPRRYYFFRVRSASSFSSEAETKDPKQFTYPPPKDCTSVGRAHIPGYPVFYGSDSYEAAIREMKTPDEEHYFISCWYTDETKLSQLNFLFANNIVAKRLLENFDRAVKDMWAQHNVTDNLNRGRIKAHLCAWSDLYITDNYALTSSISHQNMYGSYANHKVICYGSAIDGSAINYALHPDIANELKLHRVYSVSVSGPNSEIGFIQCATINDENNLNWRQIREEDLPQNDPFLPTKIEGDNNA